MGKKKFIDKKKSATFQLIPRDSSDPNYDDSPGNDRVFFRVDNNYSYSTETFLGTNNCGEDPESRFADAPEDCDAGDFESSSRSLPDDVRKEILKLGFPDDGYNYLLHMRDVRNIGEVYDNPKTRFDRVPSDVKAYDASRLPISEWSDEDNDEECMFNVASRTFGVRVQRVFDPEVAALLDGDDIPDDMEDDFAVQANLPKDEGILADKGFVLHDKVENNNILGHPHIAVDSSSRRGCGYQESEAKDEIAVEKPRVQRLLDEQFDLLESQEYGSDDEDGDGYGYIGDEEESLAEKLKSAFNHNDAEDMEFDGKYRAPADLLYADGKLKNTEHLDSARDVIRRCVEYAEKYEKDDLQEGVAIIEKSSDESEFWDCETIVSTYSNLDNHPGKIESPYVTRKKKLSEAVSGALNSTNPKIVLKGKERLPVDFLPHGKQPLTENVKGGINLKTEQQKRKPHGQESKEEKKERKSTVKEERREARKMKKEMKGLYKSEAQRAQKVAAIACPSSIRLM